MKIGRIAPALLLACSAPSAPQFPAEPPDAAADHAQAENPQAGGIDAADSRRARDTTPAFPDCLPVRVPAGFLPMKLADVQQFDSQPSIQIGRDGAPRVVFLDRGAPDNLDITLRAAVLPVPAGAASPPAAQVVTLASSLYPWTPARVVATRTGELRGVYIAWVHDHAHSLAHYLTWSGERQDLPVDTVVSADVTAAAPDIVLDRSDQPILGLVYTADLSMRLLRPSAAGWTREVVEIGVRPFDTLMSIGLDSEGSPLVAAVPIQHQDGMSSPLLPGSEGINVWTNGGAGWSREVLEPDRRYFEVHLAPGRSSAPSSLFGWDDNSGLSRLRRWSSDWEADVPLSDAAGKHLSGIGNVIVGSGGEIHVGYQQMSGGTGYAIYDGCHWSQVLVDADGGIPTITLDAAGRPYLAYERVSAGGTAEVWYAAPR